ncbi:hypothetical protein [Arthrobacter sp. 8AJ]|uniref:hypothetical protein n=1 Tax=Arthrobacter sp. 8AJ TaxID=2653130 RepID=UPI0012F1F6C4|nr:hypothetical protein [Arthrobacter sp. 8AJ]VXB14232.1 conserved membrane hypothetical protein [Arthrobacter sp. 8AJ]
MPDATAYGYAQRRSWIFFAWWYPAVLASAGLLHAVLALALGQSAETGIGMAVLGAVLASTGWALTAWLRFTRRPPRPASNLLRVERGIRGTPVMVWTILVATTAAVVALILFTPNGASPENLPVLGLLITVPLGSAAGLLHTRRLMCNNAGLYARWLERRSLTEHS